jgi:hypothetical protein
VARNKELCNAKLKASMPFLNYVCVVVIVTFIVYFLVCILTAVTVLLIEILPASTPKFINFVFLLLVEFALLF